MRAGSRASSRNSSLVTTCSWPGISSGIGRAPAAIKMYRALSSRPSVTIASLTGEAGDPVKSVDAVFGEIFFQIAGDRIGEAAFKHHQVAPIDPRLACDAMRAHTRLRIDRLRTAHQHSLRIAAAEGASPAKGTMIDQCYRPPCRTHSRACRLRASARADDHEIVGFHDVVSVEGK